eukprot:5588167-Amphidinium_carterae.1
MYRSPSDDLRQLVVGVVVVAAVLPLQRLPALEASLNPEVPGSSPFFCLWPQRPHLPQYPAKYVSPLPPPPAEAPLP